MLRNREGLSQEQLAERLTVSRQSVSKWELGQSTPDLDYVVQLSDVFNVSLDYLVKDCENSYAYADNHKADTVKDTLSSKHGVLEDTVFSKFPFPFSIPAFIICSLFGFHSGWNWLGKGEPTLMQRLPIPFAVGVIYVVLCLCGVVSWHPAWIIFLTIPIYYLIAWGLRENKFKTK